MLISKRHVLMWLAIGFVSVGAVSCTTTHTEVQCGPNDVPIRLSDKTIDTLTDQQVKDILSFNESLVDKGCAVHNKG